MAVVVIKLLEIIDIQHTDGNEGIVLGPEDPESMEYALERGKALNAGSCRFVGSFAADAEDLREAFNLMYRETEGVSFFAIDACWKDPSLYAKIKDAIRYAKDNNR